MYSPSAQVSRSGVKIGWTDRFWIVVALAGIVVVAFVLRAYAAGWGLPYVDHHDEPSAANTVLGMLRHGDWNPRFFKKPSLYYYALRIAFEAHWRYGLANGLYTDLAQLPRGTYYYITTPGFFVWGRVLTALLGAATLPVVYAIGRRWWGAAVGLGAAGVLAVLPFHVRNSQFLTVDVLTGLTTALALAAALKLLDDGRWRAYALAGLLTGLAASTKYNAGFLMATPYALITPGAFIDGVFKQYADYNAPGGDLFRRWPVAGYLSFFWSDGLLPLPCSAALIGAFVVVRRRDRAGLVMIGFALPYLLFVLAQHKHFFRNLMPIYPVLMLLVGIGVVETAAYVRGRIARRPTAPAADRQSAPRGRLERGALLLAALVAIHPLINTIALDRLFAQPHSKVRAGDYVRAQLPRGAPIAMALNSAAWPDEPMATITEDVAEHDADWYRSQGYRYLVGNVRTNPQSYAALRAQAYVLAEFEGELDGRPSPQMEVLDLGLRPDQLTIERREIVFGDELRLLGFQSGAGPLRAAFSPLPGAAAVQPKQALQLNLYWQPLKKIDKDYVIFLHLLDAQGRVVTQRDTAIRGYDYPTSRWQPGELAIDLADLFIPPEAPAGTYRLEMGVYDSQTMQRLPSAGAPDGAQTLTEIQVRRKA